MYTIIVIWKVCIVFLVKIPGNFPEIKIFGKIGINLRKFSGGNFWTHNPNSTHHNDYLMVVFTNLKISQHGMPLPVCQLEIN